MLNRFNKEQYCRGGISQKIKAVFKWKKLKVRAKLNFQKNRRILPFFAIFVTFLLDLEALDC